MKKLKRKIQSLEAQIVDACSAFSNDTGLEINEIYFRCDHHRITENGGARTIKKYRVVVEIKL